MQRFKELTVLVTGGTHGMGLQTAIRFAQEGASICIAGRDSNKGVDALAILKKITDKVIFVSCDISHNVSVKNMVRTCVDKFGGIDVAFNNAGVSSEYAKLADTNENQWENVLKINSCGTYFCMKYEIEAMLKNNGGVIVNNASCVGITAIANQSAYVASKHAVIGLTKGAALDYAVATKDMPQIRINAIAPGPIMGGMNTNHDGESENVKRKKSLIAMNRFGSQDEVASTVLWLASPEASYITGTIIPIDGGMTAGK